MTLKLCHLFFLLVIIRSCTLGLQLPGCSVKICTDLPEREPVFINNNYELMIPQNGWLNSTEGQTSWIACLRTQSQSNNIIIGDIHTSSKYRRAG